MSLGAARQDRARCDGSPSRDQPFAPRRRRATVSRRRSTSACAARECVVRAGGPRLPRPGRASCTRSSAASSCWSTPSTMAPGSSSPGGSDCRFAHRARTRSRDHGRRADARAGPELRISSGKQPVIPSRLPPARPPSQLHTRSAFVVACPSFCSSSRSLCRLLTGVYLIDRMIPRGNRQLRLDPFAAGGARR